jgi:hypothetical protein
LASFPKIEEKNFLVGFFEGRELGALVLLCFSGEKILLHTKR